MTVRLNMFVSNMKKNYFEYGHHKNIQPDYSYRVLQFMKGNLRQLISHEEVSEIHKYQIATQRLATVYFRVLCTEP